MIDAVPCQIIDGVTVVLKDDVIDMLRVQWNIDDRKTQDAEFKRWCRRNRVVYCGPDSDSVDAINDKKTLTKLKTYAAIVVDTVS